MLMMDGVVVVGVDRPLRDRADGHVVVIGGPLGRVRTSKGANFRGVSDFSWSLWGVAGVCFINNCSCIWRVRPPGIGSVWACVAHTPCTIRVVWPLHGRARRQGVGLGRYAPPSLRVLPSGIANLFRLLRSHGGHGTLAAMSRTGSPKYLGKCSCDQPIETPSCAEV